MSPPNFRRMDVAASTKFFPFTLNVQDYWLIDGRDRDSDDLQLRSELESCMLPLVGNTAHQVETRGELFVVAITQVLPGDRSHERIIGDQ